MGLLVGAHLCVRPRRGLTDPTAGQGFIRCHPADGRPAGGDKPHPYVRLAVSWCTVKGVYARRARLQREWERGAGLVEFALLTQLLVLLLVGVLEFGRVLDAWVVVTNAAREGARYGAAGATATTIQQKAYAYLAGSLQAVRGDIVMPAQSDIAVVGAGNTSHGPVQVTVPARVQIFTPMIAGLFPQNPVTVHGSATMRAQ